LGASTTVVNGAFFPAAEDGPEKQTSGEKHICDEKQISDEKQRFEKQISDGEQADTEKH